MFTRRSSSDVHDGMTAFSFSVIAAMSGPGKLPLPRRFRTGFRFFLAILGPQRHGHREQVAIQAGYYVLGGVWASISRA